MTTSVISRLGNAPEEGIKAPCLTSSDVNLVLQGTGQTIGGVVTSTGDRVLVRSQTVDAENGIYLVGPDAWERATDMNAANDVMNGQLVADANTGVLYVIVVGLTWDPGSTPINFVSFATMPNRAVITDNSTIDLTDTLVALITGAADPDTEQHLEYDHSSIQSKSNATTAAVLNLNPLGGDVSIGVGNLVLAALATVDGRDVSVDGATLDAHVGDASIHFTQAAISITASQVSDFAAAVASTPPAAHTHVEADITDLQAYLLPGDSITALDASNHRLFYSDGSGNVVELAFGAAATVLTSNGASSAPSFQAAPGGGGTTVEPLQTGIGSSADFNTLVNPRWIEITIDDLEPQSSIVEVEINLGSGGIETVGYVSDTTEIDGVGFVELAEVDTSSGSANVSLGSSLPAGITEFTVHFENFSTDGNSNTRIVLGDAGGIEITGYESASSNILDNNDANTATSAVGANIDRNATGNLINGHVTFKRKNETTDQWTWAGVMADRQGSRTWTMGGFKEITTDLTDVELDPAGDNFDNGTVQMTYIQPIRRTTRNFTDGFIIDPNNSNAKLTGTLRLVLRDETNFHWIATGTFYDRDNGKEYRVNGTFDCTGEVDEIRVRSSNVTSFADGRVGVTWGT
jgi:hypothetical protein